VLALAIVIVGWGIYYYLRADSRAIAYHRARMLQPGVRHKASDDEDALVKLGWLVRRDIHLNHQTIKTNAAMEVFAVKSAMHIELKEPAFFGVWRADPHKPAEITLWAYRGDMPAVERIMAAFDSQAQE
jgi:hypothetical protein